MNSEWEKQKPKPGPIAQGEQIYCPPTLSPPPFAGVTVQESNSILHARLG